MSARGRHLNSASATSKKDNTNKLPKRKIPCPSSDTFDRKHLTLYNGCPYKHKLFHWEGSVENRVGLISDSICKWVRGMKYLETQAVPGLTLENAFLMLVKRELKSWDFTALIIHVGCNNLDDEKQYPVHIMEKTYAILNFIRTSIFPTPKLAVSMIIPRPCDDPKMENKRVLTNLMIKWLCKQLGVIYLTTFKNVSIDNAEDRKLYANDWKHLNWDGIMKLRGYFKGVTATLMDKKL